PGVPALGRDDREALAVLDVEQRRDAPRAALRTDVMKKQHPHAAERPTQPPAARAEECQVRALHELPRAGCERRRQQVEELVADLEDRSGGGSAAQAAALRLVRLPLLLRARGRDARAITPATNSSAPPAVSIHSPGPASAWASSNCWPSTPVLWMSG